MNGVSGSDAGANNVLAGWCGSGETGVNDTGGSDGNASYLHLSYNGAGSGVASPLVLARAQARSLEFTKVGDS